MNAMQKVSAPLLCSAKMWFENQDDENAHISGRACLAGADVGVNGRRVSTPSGTLWRANGRF
jgi:hypothetical protein